MCHLCGGCGIPPSFRLRCPGLVRRLQHLEAILRMNLLERRCLPQLSRGISEDSLVCGTVVKSVSFDVYQRNHVRRIFRDDLKQLFALVGLPPDPIDAQLIPDHEDRHRAQTYPIPLRHHARKISAILPRRVNASVGPEFLPPRVWRFPLRRTAFASAFRVNWKIMDGVNGG